MYTAELPTKITTKKFQNKGSVYIHHLHGACKVKVHMCQAAGKHMYVFMSAGHVWKWHAGNQPAWNWHRSTGCWGGDLTHLPLDKMAAILADDTFKSIFMHENNRILIRISLKFIPRSAIDNTPALVQVIAWCQTGDKPLPEQMLTQFTDANIRH